MKRGGNGFSIIEVIVVITLMVFIAVLGQLSYSGYKKNAIKNLHVMAAKMIVITVQNGIVEGWVSPPAVGKTTDINLENIVINGKITAIDPSSSTEGHYDPKSFVQIYNNNASFQFYIKLKKIGDPHIYIDTTGNPDSPGSKLVTFLTVNDVQIPEEND